MLLIVNIVIIKVFGNIKDCSCGKEIINVFLIYYVIFYYNLMLNIVIWLVYRRRLLIIFSVGNLFGNR